MKTTVKVGPTSPLPPRTVTSHGFVSSPANLKGTQGRYTIAAYPQSAKDVPKKLAS